MNETIWIQGRYESQYGLLGRMAEELRQAFIARGHDARVMDLGRDEHPTSGVFIFFNAPVSLDVLPEALFTPGSALRGVQIFVDHPFGLPDDVLDAWHERDAMANYRLCLPCVDDVHLLAMRWPGIRHDCMRHGISRDALCDPESITRESWDAKEFDVVLTGSVGSKEKHESAIAALNPSVRVMVQEMIALMVARPGIGYLQASDVVMGSRGVITGKWASAKMFWRLVIAEVNRQRRAAVVRSLQGLRVGVFGSEEWTSYCTGTVSYEGLVGYEQVADAFARGRIGLAWGPTQFVHSSSERVMLAMAAGCAAISDDRLMIRRDFVGKQTCVGLYDAGQPATARGCVDKMLANPDAAVTLARAGRSVVEQGHLWEHRVDTILAQPGVLSVGG
ncbi:MAG: glycosyltransferase family 1 protein [Phycisphaerales bacterium]|nr:glycosyltransferase family 1 protein [Phycisphaerales bacterium]